MTRSLKFNIFFAAAIVLSCFGRLLAQTNANVAQEQGYRENLDSMVNEDKEEAGVRHEVDAYLRYVPVCSVEAQAGKVAIIEAAEEYSYAFKAFGKLPLELSLESEYIDIEETTAVSLPSHLTGLALGLEATLPFFKFDKTYFRIKFIPSFYTDDWQMNPSAFRIPVHTYLIYQPDHKWTLVAGVAVSPDTEGVVFPILGFIYQPNDKLTFHMVPPEPNISYKLNERLTLFMEGGFAGDEFEVTKDNLKGAVLIYQETHLGSGVKYKFNKYIEASVAAGGMFNRNLKYRDSLGKVNIKDGFYSEAKVEIKI